MNKFLKYLLILAVLAAAVYLIVSRDAEPDQQTGRETAEQQSSAQNAGTDSAKTGQDAGEEIRTISIVGTDQMKFAVKETSDRLNTADTLKVFNNQRFLLLNEIHAEPGEQIRIRLKTLSRHEAGMMSHNWVLLAQGVDPQAFVSAANREENYLPSGSEEDIIAHTELAADGETVEVTFSVPEESGRYIYLCSFMAHLAAGMKGELVVE